VGGKRDTKAAITLFQKRGNNFVVLAAQVKKNLLRTHLDLAAAFITSSPTTHPPLTQCSTLPGIKAPDLATVKDFLCFYIATSRPRLTEQPTVDSINPVAEWFFAGFTRVTRHQDGCRREERGV
ncbi:MAG: hypothetical protein Q9196_007479, partial [Gyalolechia fulgens]